jgi:hypothetical protein
VTVQVVRAFLLGSLCLAQPQPSARSGDATQSLISFLQGYLRDDPDKTVQYLVAFVDLNGDGKREAIVYLMGRGWCGSGGCNTLILTGDGRPWKVLSSITITRPPIRVLSSKSHGWHDISVWVQGGGIRPGYEAALSFNGKTYSENPSVPPARHLYGKVAGKIVIPSMEGGTPLYP